MKRYRVQPNDFDTRSLAFKIILEEHKGDWDEVANKLHIENRNNLLARLKIEFGEDNFEKKLQDFLDVGTKPFSIISYHNVLYSQARKAFVYGLYYPALTSACALGERILNHLVLDMRDNFKKTPEYKDIWRKSSFDNWDVPINTLASWNIFQVAEVKEEFHKLKDIRNRSLHFNSSTYKTLREDALAALKHLAEIISCQFGFHHNARWLLKGTKGAFFISKNYENDPFLTKYYLSQGPKVGPYHSMSYDNGSWIYFDWDNYAQEISDEEFVEIFNNKSHDKLAPSSFPLAPNAIAFKVA